MWGSSWRKEYFPPIFALLKIPQSGPILRTKKLQKNCCSFSARKHPTPPGTGTEPDASSGLGAAPAPGTRQFSQALLAVGPPVGTDPREQNPGMPQVRTRPRFCFFYHSFQGFFQNPQFGKFWSFTNPEFSFSFSHFQPQLGKFWAFANPEFAFSFSHIWGCGRHLQTLNSPLTGQKTGQK